MTHKIISINRLRIAVTFLQGTFHPKHSTTICFEVSLFDISGLSAGTGKLCIFGHLGLVFIWSCFVSCLLLLLYYVICAPVLTEGTDISVEFSPFAVKSMFWLSSEPIRLQEITYPDLVVARTDNC